MAIKKETVGAKIARVRAAYKHRDRSTGQLYNRKTELEKAWIAVTLWSLFVSDENTFLLRPHVFRSRESRNPVEWNEWLREHYGGIFRNSILPGMFNRTGKHWRLYRVIGWTPDDNIRLIRAKVSKKRHKTKRQGR